MVLKRQSGGFSLIAALVGITILGGVMVSLAIFLSHEDTRTTRQSFVRAEARDLMLLDKALRLENNIHKAEYTANWYDGATHGLPSGFTALITQDRVLPAGFANRFGAIGNSPFGQPYGMRAFGAKDLDGNPDRMTWVIHEKGVASKGLLKRVGVDSESPVSIAPLKREIADYASQHYSIHAAVVAPGTTVAIGSGHAWEIDVSSHLDGALSTSSEARVVALVNFPELESDDPEVFVPPGDKPKWDKVHLVTNRLNEQYRTYYETVCNAALGEEEIVAFPVCNAVPYTEPYYEVYASDVGTITFNWIEHKKPVVLYGNVKLEQGRHCTGPRRNDVTWCKREETIKYEIDKEQRILLNGADIGTSNNGSCSWKGWEQAYIWVSASGRRSCKRTSDNTFRWTKTDPWDGCNVAIVGWPAVAPFPKNRLCGIPVSTD